MDDATEEVIDDTLLYSGNIHAITSVSVGEIISVTSGYSSTFSINSPALAPSIHFDKIGEFWPKTDITALECSLLMVLMLNCTVGANVDIEDYVDKYNLRRHFKKG